MTNFTTGSRLPYNVLVCSVDGKQNKRDLSGALGDDKTQAYGYGMTDHGAFDLWLTPGRHTVVVGRYVKSEDGVAIVVWKKAVYEIEVAAGTEYRLAFDREFEDDAGENPKSPWEAVLINSDSDQRIPLRPTGATEICQAEGVVRAISW